ncbi:hypothetical protein PBI_SCTP2_435 [Salicola phage SCTP-2]|nr:hypothetical protein PBI_SCTP2_435 [Salicola phage SCTP-2]
MPSMRDYINLIDSYSKNQILLESYKDARKSFLDIENDEAVVDDYLNRFKNLSKQNKISGQNKDISYWIKQGWEDFKQFVDEAEKQYTKTQVKKRKAHDTSDSITLISGSEDSNIEIVAVPLTKNASCFYGKDTQWCTSVVSEDNRFGHYVGSGSILVYIITKDDKKYALVYDIINNNIEELRNSEDNLVNSNKVESNTGIEPELIVKQLKKYMNTLEKVSKKYRTTDAYTAYRYAKKTGKRFEEGEDVISEDTMISYFYAKNILKDRFYKAELKMGRGQFDDDTDEVNKYITRYIEEFQHSGERLKPLENYIFSVQTSTSLKGTYIQRLDGESIDENEEYIIDLLHNEEKMSYTKTFYLYLNNIIESNYYVEKLENFLSKINEADLKPIIDLLSDIKINPKATTVIYNYMIEHHSEFVKNMSNVQLLRALVESEYKGSMKKLLDYIDYDQIFESDNIVTTLLSRFIKNNGSKAIKDLKKYMNDEDWISWFKKSPIFEHRNMLQFIDADFPVNEIIRKIINIERQNNRNNVLEDFNPSQDVINKINDEVRDLMIEHNGKLINLFDVDNIDEELMNKSLETYPYNIKHIDNPTEQQIAKALKGAFDLDIEFELREHLDNIYMTLIKTINNNHSLSKYYRFLENELEKELE